MAEAAACTSFCVRVSPNRPKGIKLCPSSFYGMRQQFFPKLKNSVSSRSSQACNKTIRADSSSHDDSSSTVEIEIPDFEVDRALAPLKPETPSGQFLIQTLKENPHLFHAAAEQQLELLAEERISQEQPNSVSPDYILYKRIAQLKAEERRRAVQEVIYALVVQRFIKSGIKMVPKIFALVNKDGGAAWISQEKELEGVHSPEAFEMIKEHMEMVLGGPATLSRVESQTVAQISKLRVGQIYATSVMYGYFLKRVDERYQLEKKMKILTTMVTDSVHGVAQVLGIEKRKADSSSSVQEISDLSGDLTTEIMGSAAASNTQVALKPNNLRAYVGGFDKETLSRYATMRTHETVDLIERHAEALFGRPDLKVGPDGTVGLARDDTIHIKFSSLRALVLEAAAFGSHLWEVESFVDTHYSLVPRRK